MQSTVYAPGEFGMETGLNEPSGSRYYPVNLRWLLGNTLANSLRNQAVSKWKRLSFMVFSLSVITNCFYNNLFAGKGGHWVYDWMKRKEFINCAFFTRNLNPDIYHAGHLHCKSALTNSPLQISDRMKGENRRYNTENFDSFLSVTTRYSTKQWVQSW